MVPCGCHRGTHSEGVLVPGTTFVSGSNRISFAGQFANAGMMSQSYPQIPNSAFTQLMNLQRNAAARAPSYLDYNTFAKPTDRPAGYGVA